MDVTNCFLVLIGFGVAKAPLEGEDDIFSAQTQSARASHREHKGKAELLRISKVELVQLLVLRFATKSQSRHGLLVLGVLGQVDFVDGCFAREFGVGLDQMELSRHRRLAQCLGQLPLKIRHACKGSTLQGLADNPV